MKAINTCSSSIQTPMQTKFARPAKMFSPLGSTSGHTFFESVELLTELKKRHYQNYLCLCPNHSAMFRFANGSKQSLTESIVLRTGKQVPIVLANQELTIYFTKTHLADLQAIIKTEANEPSPDEGA